MDSKSYEMGYCPMVMNNASFALSELRSNYKNSWLLLTPAKRRENGTVVVWDLVDHFERKSEAKNKLEKLRRSGLQNCVMYWTKPCQCNISLVGKSEDDEEVWFPEECAEFMRCYYGLYAV